MIDASNLSLGSVTNALAAGNFAGNLSSAVTGGVNGLAGAVKNSIPGLAGVADSAKGVAAGAFAAITKSFKPLGAPGVPQNLTAIAEKAAAAEAAVAASPQNPTDLKLAAGLLGNVASSASGAIGSATGALGSLPNLSAVTGAVSSVTGAVNNASAAISSAAKAAGSAYPGVSHA